MDASVRDTFPDEDNPLGPFLGNLPSDVLRVVLGHLTPFERALFARAGGACYRAAKQSGLGRENGIESIREYLQTKSVWISTADDVPNPFVMR